MFETLPLANVSVPGQKRTSADFRGGHVIEAPSWSYEEVVYGQARDKRARAAHYTAKASTHLETEPAKASVAIERKGWLKSIRDFLARRR